MQTTTSPPPLAAGVAATGAPPAARVAVTGAPPAAGTSGPDAPPGLRPAAALEAYLGDAWATTGPGTLADAVVTDEQELMPWPTLTALRRWGLPGMLVPVTEGGRLHSVEELFGVFRVLARRDMRPVIAYGSTLLGALPVWLWGDAGQRSRVAARILAGDYGSCAISEREHGSDLAGNECRAVRDGDTYRLTGRKWPIGNATRGSYVTVLAGTGPQAYSLLLVEKAELDPAGWENLPVAPTVGLRGHDLSGLVFDDCAVPATALLGREGTGISQTLRTLQVTRTLIAGLSLGSLDTGLRIALRHADRRRLYGGPIAELPVIADALLRAYLDILIGECVAVPVTRAVAAAPGRMSLWSSVVKYLVPVLAEESLSELATILSARAFLREELDERAFQKLHRDHSIASVFEGTTHVNLSAVASQLPTALAAAAHAAAGPGPEPATGDADPGQVGGDRPAGRVVDDRLRVLFDRYVPAPPWHPDGSVTRLTVDGPDEITAGWAEAVRQVRALAADDGTGVLADLVRVLGYWDGIRADYQRDLRELAEVRVERQVPVAAFTLARTHCLWHAAAACLHTWLINRDRLPGGSATGEWLVLCLERLAQRVDTRRELTRRYRDPVLAQLRHQYHEGLLFSLTPIVLDGR